jgi:prepilin-type N-terminal cleavage/methylation domain-containing protein
MSRDRRAGFTLWELTMVLLILAITATLSAPAWARLGEGKPAGAADAVLGLLHDARKAAIDRHVTSALHLDPKSMRYELDTTGFSGTGIFAAGTLDLGATQTLASDQPRLQFVFQRTGASFADTVVVHGADRPMVVRVDPWSGVARADTL